MIDFLDLENFHDELLDGIHILRLGFILLIPRWEASIPFTGCIRRGYEVIFLGAEYSGRSNNHGS